MGSSVAVCMSCRLMGEESLKRRRALANKTGKNARDARDACERGARWGPMRREWPA